jgi:membrane protein implicated in regulation of membrane protease activity
MKKKKTKKTEEIGIFRGIFMAYSILLLHVVLLAALGCLVLFFRGFIQYMLWIFLAGAGLIVYSGYRIYRRMKTERKNLRTLLALPEMRNRTVEVSLLDGFASVRLGHNDRMDDLPALPPSDCIEVPRIESRPSSRIRELTELARLLENQMITMDEYNRTKARLLDGAAGS